MRKHAMKIALLAAVFLQGATASLLLRYWQAASSPAPQDDTAATAVDEALFSVDVSATTRRTLAEQAIAADDASSAIPHLTVLLMQSREEGLAFRLAVCLESTGEYEKAIHRYRQVLAGTRNEHLAVLCRNGLARCQLLTGDNVAARDTLWRQYQRQNGLTQAESVHETMLLLAMACCNPEPPEIRGVPDGHFILHATVPDVDIAEQQRRLAVVDASKPASVPGATTGADSGSTQLESTSPATTEASTEQEMPQQNGSNAVATSVTATLPIGQVTLSETVRAGQGPEGAVGTVLAHQCSLLSAVQAIQDEFGIPIQITERAAAIAGTQSLTLEARLTGLPQILDMATLPYGLGWEWQPSQEQLVVFSRDEATPELGEELLRSFAVRTLENFRYSAPESDYTPSALFLLAGQYVDNDLIDFAIDAYMAVLDGTRSATLRQRTWFNLAQLYAARADTDSAAKAYMKVVDETLLNPLVSLAHLKLGEVYLESGRFELAISSFGRASLNASDNRVKELGVLGEALCHFLQQRAEFIATLLKKRDGHIASLDVDQAITLMLRTQALATDSTSQQAMTGNWKAVLQTLEALHWPADFPVAGHYVRGQAFRQLGLDEEALKHFRISFQQERGPWLREQTAYQLVSALETANRTQDLRQFLELVAKTEESNELVGFALQQRIALEYREGNIDTCVALCTELLRQPEYRPVFADALKYLGRILDARGDRTGAAFCFSGVVPPEFASPMPIKLESLPTPAETTSDIEGAAE